MPLLKIKYELLRSDELTRLSVLSVHLSNIHLPDHHKVTITLSLFVFQTLEAESDD